ncbi:MAG: SET domain-containing protein-lysine N-methyltransferase [Gemmatimonadetes bacterium]|nr:SET domain-containing protein-lysine N-methyltransferase [Gemmatimonadota bacterium]
MARRKVKPAADRAGQPFVVKNSRIAGRGGFATRAIETGERIIEYLGERVTHAVADARYDDYASATHHTFLFAVSRQTVIDAAVDGNDARFLNHSCDPNCEAVIERSRVFIVALKPIAKGEELVYDYAYTRDGSETEEEEYTLYGCRCGTKKCRGTILAPLTPAELKKRAAAAKKRHHPRHAVARTGHEG